MALRIVAKAFGLALGVAAATLLAGCYGFGNDIERVFACKGPNCEYEPGPWVRSLGARFSADGGEITLPFLCRPPKITKNQTRALAYSVATGAWRTVAGPVPGLHFDDVRAVPGDRYSIRSCAADCSKFAYLARTDKTNPKDRYEEFYELFYSENGKVRQITHFDDAYVKYSSVELSTDARKVLIQSNLSEKLTLVDVESGSVTDVSLRDAMWKDCTGGQ